MEGAEKEGAPFSPSTEKEGSNIDTIYSRFIHTILP